MEYEELQSRLFNGLNTFEHDDSVSVTDWRKVGCVKKFLSGHMGDRWFRSHRTILSFLEYAYEDELNKVSTYIPKG